MTVIEISALFGLAVAVGGLLGGGFIWFGTRRVREAAADVRAKGLAENNLLLKEQNALLRQSHDDAQRELRDMQGVVEERGRRIGELEKAMDVIKERITSKAAVDELAGALAIFSSSIREQQAELRRDLAAIQRSTAEWQAAEARERAQGRKESAEEHQRLADVLERIAQSLPPARAA